MEVKYLDKTNIVKANVENKTVHRVRMFNAENLSGDIVNDSKVLQNAKIDKVLAISSEEFEKGAAYNNLRINIERLMEERKQNAIQFDPVKYYELMEYTALMLGSRMLTQPDLCQILDENKFDASATQTVKLKKLLGLSAIFDRIAGTGDSVNLMQPVYGGEDFLELFLDGVGHEETFLNTLFDTTFNELDEVLKAVAEGWVALKNHRTIEPILNASYTTNQTVDYVTTGSTDEENMYLTVDNAITALTGMDHPFDGNPIDASGRITALINPKDKRKIIRAINGVINNNSEQVNRQELLTDINQIVPYRGWFGRMGKKTVSYDGIPEGTMFLMIPKEYRINLDKMGLTQFMTQGDNAHTLSQTKRSWVACRGSWQKAFFGSADAEIKDMYEALFPENDADNVGFIVKVAISA